MTDQPIPSTEAVVAAAQALYKQAQDTAAQHPWDSLDPVVKFKVSAMALDILVAAYPQIVADVLRAQADDWEQACAGDVKARCRCSEVTDLRDRADEVLA